MFVISRDLFLIASQAACKNCVVEEAVANNLCLHGGYTFLTKLRGTSPFDSVVRGANCVIEQLLKIILAMTCRVVCLQLSRLKTASPLRAMPVARVSRWTVDSKVRYIWKKVILISLL